MKQIIPILLIALIFLSGCTSNTEMKYQCFNGIVVDSVELCPKQNCPDLNCSECPKQVETETKEVIKYECYDGSIEEELTDCNEPEPIIKYQCQDGTIKVNIIDCDIIEISNAPNIDDENVNYKFDNYLDYQQYVANELEAETGVDDIRKYGSDISAKFGGSVYFLMSKGDSWGETYRFWAVQVNAETGKLIKYKEISNDGCSGQLGKCPNTNQIWW